MPKEGSVMQGIFISERDPQSGETLIFAKRGEFISSPEDLSVTLALEDGSIHIPDNKNNTKSDTNAPFHVVNFKKYNLSLMSKRSIGKAVGEKPDRELYLSDLIGMISAERASGDKNLKKHTTQHVISLHKRFAMPASIFIFALLAIPLGIRRVRSTGLGSFSVGITVILIYFTISLSLETLAESERLNPIVAMWSTNIIFALFGAFIFHKSAKEIPIKSLVLFDSALHHIKDSIKKAANKK